MSMSESQGQEVADLAWLDLSDGTVSFSVSERVTLTFRLEEFMQFSNSVTSIVETLKETPGIVLGTYEKDGEVYEEFMLSPEDDDFN